MKRIALPAGRLNPSLGVAWQIVELTVTRLAMLHIGGLPLAGRLKAKTSRRLSPSHPAFTSVAMHAGGTPPEFESSGVVASTFV
jgi:hypothetical protein